MIQGVKMASGLSDLTDQAEEALFWLLLFLYWQINFAIWDKYILQFQVSGISDLTDQAEEAAF